MLHRTSDLNSDLRYNFVIFFVFVCEHTQPSMWLTRRAVACVCNILHSFRPPLPCLKKEYQKGSKCNVADCRIPSLSDCLGKWMRLRLIKWTAAKWKLLNFKSQNAVFVRYVVVGGNTGLHFFSRRMRAVPAVVCIISGSSLTAHLVIIPMHHKSLPSHWLG